MKDRNRIAPEPGALPPDPRNLSNAAQSREVSHGQGQEREQERRRSARSCSASSPASALGLLSSSALSSAPAVQSTSQTSVEWKLIGNNDRMDNTTGA